MERFSTRCAHTAATRRQIDVVCLWFGRLGENTYIYIVILLPLVHLTYDVQSLSLRFIRSVVQRRARTEYMRMWQNVGL